VQFLVQRGQHAAQRAAIAPSGGIEQQGNVSGLGHPTSPEHRCKACDDAMKRPRFLDFSGIEIA